MKIILGTANVKNNYGLNSNKLNYKEFKKVENYSKKNNFFLEVAEDYKNIKSTTNNNLKLFYKINFYENKNNFHKIDNLVKKKNIFCLMIHSIKSLKHKDFKILYNYISLLKSKELIKNFGISIYDLKDLKIIKKYNFDFIQIPLNIFNQTFNNRNTLNIRNRGTKFIARSVLFQGTTLNEGYMKLKSEKLNNKNQIVKKELLKKKIHILKFYLNFIKMNTWLWGFVIGVDDLNQLKQIRHFYIQRKFSHKYQKYRIYEKKIIDPRNW